MDNDTMCCPLDGGDGETPGFYELQVVRARRSRKYKTEHECDECGTVIPCGAMHERLRYAEHRYDNRRGSVSTYRTCLLCVEIRNHFACGNGWICGEVWSQLEENFFPDMKAGGQCMTGLSPAAKQFMIDRRRAWLFDSEIEVDGARPPWAWIQRPIPTDPAKQAMIQYFAEQSGEQTAEFDRPDDRKSD
jgi:hypothetical protein